MGSDRFGRPEKTLVANISVPYLRVMSQCNLHLAWDDFTVVPTHDLCLKWQKDHDWTGGGRSWGWRGGGGFQITIYVFKLVDQGWTGSIT